MFQYVSTQEDMDKFKKYDAKSIKLLIRESSNRIIKIAIQILLKPDDDF